MSGKGGSSSRHGYSFSIRELHFLGGDDLSPPLGGQKRRGDDLVSPRKNKKAGEIATFSDDDSGIVTHHYFICFLFTYELSTFSYTFSLRNSPEINHMETAFVIQLSW